MCKCVGLSYINVKCKVNMKNTKNVDNTRLNERVGR